MKLKQYSLWALALAFAAVSCSDDLDNPNKGNENPDGNGSSTYMKVTINTGVVTRAISDLPPTGGEEGDGNEVGLVNEYRITDVTVILYKNMLDNANNTLNDSEFKPTSEIVGTGYATTTGAMGPGDDEWHSKSATVLVTARDDEDFDGNTYGIIAVTNWRSDALKNKVKNDNLNATQLANLLVETTYEKASGINRNFIMSSHIKDSKGKSEIVTLKANTTPETAPSATVHVERLAAKVRINKANDVTNYIYPIKDGTNETAKVRLDNVVLVNKLKTGSYLLKRVTPKIETGNNIPSLTEAEDSWLGDEIAKSETGTEGTVYPGTNYVIDPWTRAKIVDGSGKIVITPVAAENKDAGKPTMMDNNTPIPALDYDNKYDGTKTFSELWTGLSSSAKQLSAETENTESILIDYTMENTTSVVASKNGYSTGALFKAVYLPKQWAAVNNNNTEVEAVDVPYEGNYDKIGQSTKGQTFYTYQGNIYKDFDAIFNEFVWEKQKPLEGNKTNPKIYSYSDFTASNITNIKMAEFEASYLYKNTASDPIGYIPHLRNLIETAKKTGELGDKTFQGEDDIDKYVESTDPKIQNDVYANVKKYEDGITYYPYWIRQANNGKPTEMGIMEFGIVRNNIYDMTVKSISGLGLSGTEKPEPDKDDETKDYYFNVQINVKNWVKRNNSGIIL